MSRQELLTAIRHAANLGIAKEVSDFDLVEAFVSGMLVGFSTVTDYPGFEGVHVEPYMTEAIAGNILANANIMHTLSDIELLVAGAALMIGTIQLYEYMQKHGEQ